MTLLFVLGFVALCVGFLAVVYIVMLMPTTRHAHPDSEVNHGRSGGGWGLSTCSEPDCDWSDIY